MNWRELTRLLREILDYLGFDLFNVVSELDFSIEFETFKSQLIYG